MPSSRCAAARPPASGKPSARPSTLRRASPDQHQPKMILATYKIDSNPPASVLRRNVPAIRENGWVQLYRDDGIVLRTQKLGEADRIITILGRTSGRIRAVAKGVRRTKSRFGARLEPFTHVDLMLHAGRSLDVITQAEVIRSYGETLTGDFPRY